jgi:hypothetical protein
MVELAGAIYGASPVPTLWLQPLAWRESVFTTATRLIECGARNSRAG